MHPKPSTISPETPGNMTYCEAVAYLSNGIEIAPRWFGLRPTAWFLVGFALSAGLSLYTIYLLLR